MARGIENETNVLNEMKIPKNTKSYTVIDPKTGKPTTVIPDGVTDKQFVEIKDTKKVSDTKQIRGEIVAAKQEGKDFTIVTGEKTKVSSRIPAEEIQRRKDIGPQ